MLYLKLTVQQLAAVCISVKARHFLHSNGDKALLSTAFPHILPRHLLPRRLHLLRWRDGRCRVFILLSPSVCKLSLSAAHLSRRPVWSRRSRFCHPTPQRQHVLPTCSLFEQRQVAAGKSKYHQKQFVRDDCRGLTELRFAMSCGGNR